jgi:hypothetical protein
MHACRFLDAWQDVDAGAEPDVHPLSRASRREMQLAHNPIGLSLGAASSASASAGDDQQQLHVKSGGYGFGLSSEETLVTGRLVGHSGGYPGHGRSAACTARAATLAACPYDTMNS